VREQEQKEVSCPVQQRDYSETFHLIDKGNGKESKYDMGGQTKGHNWAPKLCMRFWNFGLGNAHTMYEALITEHTADRRYLDMEECVMILAHSLMQRGEPMRRQLAEHPKYSRDLESIFDYGTGRRTRTDAKGVAVAARSRGQPGRAAANQRMRELRRKQKKSKWRMHQSLAHTSRGHCCYQFCPGINESYADIPRTYRTSMRCEECSAATGKNIYLCNDAKKGKPVLCHVEYHKKHHDKKYDIDE
jgi:hypothetical protein